MTTNDAESSAVEEQNPMSQELRERLDAEVVRLNMEHAVRTRAADLFAEPHR